MYYRVKRYSARYSRMFVLDSDSNLNSLKSRNEIDCAGVGPKTFNNPTRIAFQRIKCVSLGGVIKGSHIIKE